MLVLCLRETNGYNTSPHSIVSLNIDNCALIFFVSLKTASNRTNRQLRFTAVNESSSNILIKMKALSVLNW